MDQYLEKGTYSIYVECLNCGKRGSVIIKKGNSVSSEECSNCGCQTLHKVGV